MSETLEQHRSKLPKLSSFLEEGNRGIRESPKTNRFDKDFEKISKKLGLDKREGAREQNEQSLKEIDPYTLGKLGFQERSQEASDTLRYVEWFITVPGTGEEVGHELVVLYELSISDNPNVSYKENLSWSFEKVYLNTIDPEARNRCAELRSKIGAREEAWEFLEKGVISKIELNISTLKDLKFCISKFQLDVGEKPKEKGKFVPMSPEEGARLSLMAKKWAEYGDGPGISEMLKKRVESKRQNQQKQGGKKIPETLQEHRSKLPKLSSFLEQANRGILESPKTDRFKKDFEKIDKKLGLDKREG
ncbi:MAG: hypothetical protein WC369_00055 [Dehalococcoidales bacterium]|jgi:hypothetical protein